MSGSLEPPKVIAVCDSRDATRIARVGGSCAALRLTRVLGGRYNGRMDPTPRALAAIGALALMVAGFVAVVFLWGAGFLGVIAWAASLGPTYGMQMLLLAPFVLIVLVCLAGVGMLLWQRTRPPVTLR